jgi:hypothetical protein
MIVINLPEKCEFEFDKLREGDMFLNIDKHTCLKIPACRGREGDTYNTYNINKNRLEWTLLPQLVIPVNVEMHLSYRYLNNFGNE